MIDELRIIRSYLEDTLLPVKEPEDFVEVFAALRVIEKALAPPEPNEDGLLPCGCGGKVEVVHDEDSGYVQVVCDCGQQTETFWGPESDIECLEEDATNAWNRAMSHSHVVYEKARDEDA